MKVAKLKSKVVVETIPRKSQELNEVSKPKKIYIHSIFQNHWFWIKHFPSFHLQKSVLFLTSVRVFSALRKKYKIHGKQFSGGAEVWGDFCMTILVYAAAFFHYFCVGLFKNDADVESIRPQNWVSVKWVRGSEREGVRVWFVKFLAVGGAAASTKTQSHTAPAILPQIPKHNTHTTREIIREEFSQKFEQVSPVNILLLN